MSEQQTNTYFAPAERSSEEKLKDQINSFNTSAILRSLMEGIPDLVLVLNQNRQIIAVNENASFVFFGVESKQVLGLRVGEALKCQYSNVMAGGCGTSKFCTVCGAVIAMEKTRVSSAPAEEECRITRELDGKNISLDLRVNSKIVSVNQEEFILFHIKDISSEKRKDVLERTFFHDILNTGSAIKGLAEILPSVEDVNDIEEIEEALITSADQLISEILMQRELTLAEDGRLKLKFGLCSVNEMLKKSENVFTNHELAKNKTLIVSYLENDISLILDQTAIIRSLINLIKNAFEASNEGQTVSVMFTKENDTLLFKVKNETVIPDKVKLQIFQRSFSTKQGKGRGIGTYSVKLMIEKYLEGDVSFISDDEHKTIFTISLPDKYEFKKLD
ncbi:MAG: HAMP domain-containing histidine kinase [Melioribacteraceae bacterium]|nr:HAMP domain-containing histidine kinase [Melioribacteraceae bacterium]